MIRKVVAAEVPEPPHGLFSHCLVVGDTIHLSGQHAGAPGGGLLGDGSVADQSRQALKKIQALIEAAGGSMADVVKLTFYVTDIETRSEASQVRREFFSGPTMPCSTLLGVTALSAPDLKVEIDAIAILGASR